MVTYGRAVTSRLSLSSVSVMVLTSRTLPPACSGKSGETGYWDAGALSQRRTRARERRQGFSS